MKLVKYRFINSKRKNDTLLVWSDITRWNTSSSLQRPPDIQFDDSYIKSDLRIKVNNPHSRKFIGISWKMRDVKDREKDKNT